MLKRTLRFFRKPIRWFFLKIFPEINKLNNPGNDFFLRSWINSSEISEKAKLYPLYHISNSKIGDYTYVSQNAIISQTEIGKFCSIGPNLVSGWGVHPLNGISTSPMFYSTMKQNGMTLSSVDKVVERKPIIIGNDVFIGANVTILDGVSIGDGAVIGAGAVVSKDIPPYAIAIGCPIEILRYRFDDDTRKKIQALNWWDYNETQLKDVEHFFFDVESFIQRSSQ